MNEITSHGFVENGDHSAVLRAVRAFLIFSSETEVIPDHEDFLHER
jgi:hypothetical protein